MQCIHRGEGIGGEGYEGDEGETGGGLCCLRNSEGVVMHCAVQSTLGDLGGKACQVTFLNLVEISLLNLNLYTI